MKNFLSIFLLSLSFYSSAGLAQSQSIANDSPQRVAATKALTVADMGQAIERMKIENPNTREHVLSLVSEAYTENSGNPALRLDRIWVNENSTLLELTGLQRRGNTFSAIMDVTTLYLLDLKRNTTEKLLLNVGGNEVETEEGRRMVSLLPGEKLYLFFPVIVDLNPQSLRYANWTGAEDRYFDKIDPLFNRRYDLSFQKAASNTSTIEDMKAFLVEFASSDPEKRAQKIFTDLIVRLRSDNTFDSRYQAYKLIKDPADEQMAEKLAQTTEQREKLAKAVAVVKATEANKRDELNRAREARQAELRQRDEARLAENRKQSEVRREEQRQASVVDAEAQCMSTPKCRRAWEAEQAKCSGKIQACRSGCDSLSGAGSYSNFWSGLVASGISRACYAGCKCGSGYANLLGRVPSALAGSSPPSSSESKAENVSRSASAGTESAKTERIHEHWDGDVQHISVRCARTGKERNYTFNRKSGRYCTPGYSPSCESEEWVQRAVCR